MTEELPREKNGAMRLTKISPPRTAYFCWYLLIFLPLTTATALKCNMLWRSIEGVNIQVPGLGVAASNRGLRSSVGRGVAVAGERGLRDDCGFCPMRRAGRRPRIPGM